MQFKTTGTAKIRSVKCCVLFDAETGAIQHVHRVVTMEGVTETSDADMERRALQLAKDHGIQTAKVQIAHFDAKAFAARARYKVNPKTRALMRVDAAAKVVKA
jgi:hypothetical protein